MCAVSNTPEPRPSQTPAVNARSAFGAVHVWPGGRCFCAEKWSSVGICVDPRPADPRRGRCLTVVHPGAAERATENTDKRQTGDDRISGIDGARAETQRFDVGASGHRADHGHVETGGRRGHRLGTAPVGARRICPHGRRARRAKRSICRNAPAERIDPSAVPASGADRRRRSRGTSRSHRRSVTTGSVHGLIPVVGRKRCAAAPNRRPRVRGRGRGAQRAGEDRPRSDGAALRTSKCGAGDRRCCQRPFGGCSRTRRTPPRLCTRPLATR